MKGILLLTEDAEATADWITIWLQYLTEVKIFRITEKDHIDGLEVDFSNETSTTFSLTVNRTTIKSTDVVAFFYRRGKFKFKNVINPNDVDIDLNSCSEALNKYYLGEWEHVTDYIHYLLKQTNAFSLNSYFDLRVNKLINIDIAKKYGLNIPDGIISNNIENIRKFILKNERVIVKPIRYAEGLLKIDKVNYAFSQSTNIFDIEMFENVISNKVVFQPTLFQKYLEKDFEIRCFYMKGKCFSMAIFSQNNEKTKIDFRNYDREKPNRNVPYLLPEKIENKINTFMLRNNYDTGSIDIIFHQGKYFFLEVNTVGQFGWVSKNCNYYIEKEIANKINIR